MRFYIDVAGNDEEDMLFLAVVQMSVVIMARDINVNKDL